MEFIVGLLILGLWICLALFAVQVVFFLGSMLFAAIVAGFIGLKNFVTKKIGDE
jgi:hypothetical protein